MTRTDLTDDALAARIAAACDDRSERLAVAPRAFEVDAAPSSGLPLAPAAGRHRLLLAAAAVVVVGVLVGAAVLIGTDDGPEVIRSATTATDPPPVTPASGPAWLAPSAPPLGLPLQSVAWREKADPTGSMAQLLVSDDVAGQILVVISPSGGADASPADATVRGRPATVRPSKEDGDRSTTITWDEGTTVEARFIGMDQDAAIAVLDALEWRSEDHRAGFAPPADRTWILANDALPGTVSRKAELVYADAASSTGPGVGTQIQVHTTQSEEPTLDAMQAHYLDPDGGGSEGVMRSYDDEFGTLTVSWLDGNGWNAAWIDANQTDVSEAQLRAVADSLVPTDGRAMAALEQGIGTGDQPATTTTLAPSFGPDGSGEVTTTTTAPPTTLPLDVPLVQLDGSTTTLAEVDDGRPLVVALVSLWCVPCTQTWAALDEVATAHPEAVFVAVSEGDRADEVLTYVENAGLSTPVLLDGDGALGQAWEIADLPTVVVLGPDGQVRGRTTGISDSADGVEAFVAEHLGG